MPAVLGGVPSHPKSLLGRLPGKKDWRSSNCSNHNVKPILSGYSPDGQQTLGHAIHHACLLLSAVKQKPLVEAQYAFCACYLNNGTVEMHEFLVCKLAEYISLSSAEFRWSI